MKVIILLKEQLIWMLQNIILVFLDMIRHQKIRSKMYSHVYKGLHKTTLLGRNVRVEHPESTIVEEHCLINSNFNIVGAGSVLLGSCSYIAPNVTLITTTHDTCTMEQITKGISIGSYTWIGANVTILPGVKIGKGTIIGACSVVTKDIPEGVIAVGNPALVKKKRYLSENYRLPGGMKYKKLENKS